MSSVTTRLEDTIRETMARSRVSGKLTGQAHGRSDFGENAFPTELEHFS